MNKTTTIILIIISLILILIGIKTFINYKKSYSKKVFY
jgi:hypothetical protein